MWHYSLLATKKNYRFMTHVTLLFLALRVLTIGLDTTVNIYALNLSKAFDEVNLHDHFVKLMDKNFPVNLLLLLDMLITSGAGAFGHSFPTIRASVRTCINAA